MIVMRRILIVAAVLASGCDLDMGEEGEDPVGLGESALISMNGMPWDSLSLNWVGTRALLGSPLVQSANIAALADTPEGLQVLHYAVACALPAGRQIAFKDSGRQLHTFEGMLGVYPAWPQSVPRKKDIECVVGCLAAHLNAVGAVIQISARGQACGYTVEPAEKAGFKYEEGGFAGDDELHMYVCPGEGLVKECGATAGVTVKDRRCTSGDPLCGNLIVTPPCSQICRGRSAEGGYHGCAWGGVQLDGFTTAWLGSGSHGCSSD